MARCLVIGANGFLGSHVVDELVARGHDVTAFDRFSTSTPAYSGIGVDVVAGDFLSSDDISSALVGQEFVFHFISTTTPVSAEADPTVDLRTNVASSIELFRLCVEAGVRTVYFASTGGAIYGDQDGAALTELALPRPVSPYAIGKLTIEHYLRYFERKFGLQSVSLRVSNPFGPRQHPNKVQGVIPIFLRQIHAGLPLTVYGDGSMVRDYLYIADAASMIAEVVDHETSHTVYNVGSGHGTSITEVLDIVRDVTGVAPQVRFESVPPTFVASAVLDTSRFVTEFGSRELVALRSGIELTWAAIVEEPA